MAVPYHVEGIRSGAKRQLWTERRILGARYFGPWTFTDGERVAAAVATEGQAEDRQDKVCLHLQFFDELRRLAPGSP